MEILKLPGIGEAKISTRGSVKLPSKLLREVGWKPGDRLWLKVDDAGRIVLSRRPDDIVEYFAGCLTHLYPDPEDTRRFLAEGRGYVESSDPDTEA